ncbi:MAG: NAD(P)/FAD-dependent oxidoreductase [Rhodospirillales bacterium]|nr:NAD(P)/FAD-dependent oxidoreductase [Rhodospirillales bacterium]
MESVDCAVIGAGVIGLATARELALRGHEVIVLEADQTIGAGASSRNSEVIHAGIYYPAESLKASLCLAGRHALYAYCAERAIPHCRLGKLIVATTANEIPELDALFTRGRANGVDDLERIGGVGTKRMEPALRAVAAIHSPSSGIVDSHALMLSFQGDAESRGAVVAFMSPVTGGRVEEDRIVLAIGGREACRLSCRVVVNSAGVGAQDVARRLSGMPRDSVPPRRMVKGNYFALDRSAPFERLIYPMPTASTLGVHLTLDLTGRARFGPDSELTDELSYDVAPDRAEAFYAAIRQYWPEIEDGSLHPDYAGIRTVMHEPGEPAGDFVIQGPRQHGIAGLVNLFGIDSPGLTASLAIARTVADAVSF